MLATQEQATEATVATQATQVSVEETCEYDQDGVPIFPASLKHTDRKWRIVNGPQGEWAKFLEAWKVYKIWKQNSFHTIQVDNQGSSEPLQCYYNPDLFEADIPEWDEENPNWKYYYSHLGEEEAREDPRYLSWRQEDDLNHIKRTYAKQICEECPLRSQCLGASITLQTPRGKLAREPYGVWGGYALGARDRILAVLRDLEILGDRVPDLDRLSDTEAYTLYCNM